MYITKTLPEWWNGRHERLKIFCQRWRKSSSLFSGTSNRLVLAKRFFVLKQYQYEKKRLELHSEHLRVHFKRFQEGWRRFCAFRWLL